MLTKSSMIRRYKLHTRLLGPFVILNVLISIYHLSFLDRHLLREPEEPVVFTHNDHSSRSSIPKPHSKTRNQIDSQNCEIIGDWVSLNGKTFFKKAANFYFVDLNLIVLTYLQHQDMPPNFVFNLTIMAQLNDKIYTFKQEFTEYKFFQIEKSQQKGNLESQTATIRFKLDKFIKNELNVGLGDLIGLEMSLEVVDSALRQGLRMPLDLKIKNSPHANRFEASANASHVAVCNKMVFVDNDDQLEEFRLWVKINKRLGFDKLIVYFRPGFDFGPKLSEFLNQHKEFIEAIRPICFPNAMKDQGTRYFTRLVNLEDPHDPVYRSLAPASYIYLNECYQDHFDQFKYIVAEDGDEILTPMGKSQASFGGMLFKNYKKLLSTGRVLTRPEELFVEPIVNSKPRIPNAVELGERAEYAFEKMSMNKMGMLLPHANFIKNQNFDRFCKALRQRLPQMEQEKESIVFDEDEFVMNEMRLKISIDPRSPTQKAYASYLCDLNEHVVKPWLESRQLEPAVRNYCRFFLSMNNYGKSIHSTGNVLSLHLHFARLGYDKTKKKLFAQNSRSSFCSECGYVAHVRKNQKFRVASEEEVRINHLFNGSYVQNIQFIEFDSFLFTVLDNIGNI